MECRTPFYCFIAVACLSYAVLAHGEIYQWTDSNGKVHFSDQRPRADQLSDVVPESQAHRWRGFKIAITDKSQSLTAAEVRKIETGVNHVYWLYDRVLFFDMYKTVPVNITILADEADYYAYLQEKLGPDVPPSRGMYLRADNQIVAYIQKDRARSFRTINHEVSHALLATLAPHTAAWLNEGLAEQAELLQEKLGDMRILGDRGQFRTTVNGYADESLPPLREFLAMHSGEWSRTNRHGNYGLQSYTGTFCYFLFSSVQGRALLTRLIHRYERGTQGTAVAVVDELYTGGVDMLEVQWQAFLRGAPPRYITLQ